MAMQYFEHSASSNQRRLRCERLEERRLLAVVTVDTDADLVDFSDGVTSLREAIFATNLVPGADEIRFDFGHDGPATIVLTEGELQITDDLTLTGDGAELLTIDATGNDPTPDENNGDGSRVFAINDEVFNEEIEVVLTSLTLTGGDVQGSGGAIQSGENLKLEDVVITENYATVDGGGLVLGEQALLDRVTINNNTAGRNGGGIRVVSSTEVQIRESTLSGNTAGEDGGGLWAIRGTTTKIYDSTIIRNEAVDAGGGLGFFTDRSTIVRSEIAENAARQGGGIYTRGLSARIEESHIRDNRATESGAGIYSSGRNELLLFETFVHGNRVFGLESTGGGISLHFSEATIQGGQIRDNLAHQGGGIWSESSTLKIDEVQFLSNSAAFGRTGLNARGGAIAAVDSTVQVEESIFAGNGGRAQFGGAIDLRGGVTWIRESIFTQNSASLRDTGGGAIAVARGSDVASLSITAGRFFGNMSSSIGGALVIYEGANVAIDASQFNNNQTFGGDGGAIALVEGSHLSITDTEFGNNQARRNGGAIYAAGSLKLEHSFLNDNQAEDSGGGLYALLDSASSNIQILSSTLFRNRTGDGHGGGVYIANQAGIVELTNSTVAENHARLDGGGIYFTSSAPVNLVQSRSTGNRNPVAPTNHIRHSTIAHNQADEGSGNGITKRIADVHLTHTIVFANEGNDFSGDLAAISGDDQPFVADYSILGTVAPETPLLANNTFLGVNPGLRGPQQIEHHPGLVFVPTFEIAIDAGDPNLQPGTEGLPEFDQRGVPFTRVAQGRIDIGAYEVQTNQGLFYGDTDNDGDVDGADFLAILRGLGSRRGTSLATGDLTGNRTVDGNDIAVWANTFGDRRRPRRATATESTDSESSLARQAIDIAIVENFQRESYTPVARRSAFRQEHTQQVEIAPRVVDLVWQRADPPHTGEHLSKPVIARGAGPEDLEPLSAAEAIDTYFSSE